MLRLIGILIAALLLDGDGGSDDGEAGALAKLSELMDKRIDAAFERWLEKGKTGSGDGDPPKPADGDPPKPAGDGEPPKPPEPAKAPGFFELLFGTAKAGK
jgi:hypothetical protein